MQKFGEDGLPIQNQEQEEEEEENYDKLGMVDSFAAIHEEANASKILCWTCAHGLARKQVQRAKQREGDEWKDESEDDSHKFWNVICTRLQELPNQFLTSELLACNRYQPREDARDMLNIEEGKHDTPSTKFMGTKSNEQDLGQGAMLES